MVRFFKKLCGSSQSESDKIIADLQNRLHIAESENSKLKTKLVQAEQTIKQKESEAKLNKLHSDNLLQKMQLILDAEKVKNARLERENARLERENACLKSQFEKTQDQLNQLKNEHKILLNRYKKLAEENRIQCQVNHDLQTQNDKLEAQCAAKQKEIEKLKIQLSESEKAGKRQAHPFAKKKTKPDPKKPGRKHGHKPAHRPPPEKIDRVIEVPCCCCPECQAELVDPVVHVQYQTDLPPIVPIVTQYNIQGGTCPKCKKYRQGRHPEMISDATGAAQNQIGPVALSMASEMKHRLGVPYRKIQDLFKNYFGLSISHSTLVRAEQRLAKKGEPTFRLLIEALRLSNIVHADETGWRVGRISSWLWVFCTKKITIYAIADNRSHEVPEAILTENFNGILIVDGWSAYDVLTCEKGRCNAHIINRCRDRIEKGMQPRAEKQLVQLMTILRKGMDLSKQFESLSEESYWESMQKWEAEFDGWLMSIRESADEEVVKIRNHLVKYHDEFMAHLLKPGTPATNNQGERQIKPSLAIRKIGSCNKTAVGAMVHMVLASIMATMRQQGKRFIDLAIPLWRSAKPIAINISKLPEIEEMPIPNEDKKVKEATQWPKSKQKVDSA